MTAFLRGLAPQRAGDPTRAVVALPSRFEQVRPLRGVHAAPAPAAERSDERADSPSTLRPAAVRLEAPTTAPRADDAEAAVRVELLPTRASAEPLLVERVAASRAVDDGAPPPAASRAVRRHQDDRQPFVHIRALDVDDQDIPAAAATVRPSRRTVAVPAPAGLVSQDASSPVRLGERSERPERPLSAQTVAARAAQTIERQPVINVTIDRIEVRAPAAPARPSRLPARTESPRVSLTDYLRTREPGRRGGVS